MKTLSKDRIVAPDIERLAELVESGSIVEAAERAVGAIRLGS